MKKTLDETLREAAKGMNLSPSETDQVADRVLSAIETQIRLGIQCTAALVNDTSRQAGWYTDPATGAPIKRNVGEVVALMHSELSEALEAWRTDAMDKHLPHRPGMEVEFADCIIRILDAACDLGLDVAGALIEKNRFNRTRADHKLEARRAPGGKKI